MKFKDSKTSYSILLFLFLFSCSPNEPVNNEIVNKEKSTDFADTTFTIEDLYFLQGDWIDSVTFKVYDTKFLDSWNIVNDSIIGKSFKLIKNNTAIDTLSTETMTMMTVGERVMYIIRSPGAPILVYPSFKKSGDSLVFKNKANESLQEIIFINDSEEDLKLLLRGYKTDYKREIIYNYKRI